MSRPLAIALLAAASLIAFAPASARPLKPAEEAKIRPVGKPVNCIQPSRIRQTRVRDDRTIDFYMIDNSVYRNRLPYACSSLGFEERFGYESTNDQLCSIDVIHVLQSPPGIPGPTCGLGPFQPVTGAPPQ